MISVLLVDDHDLVRTGLKRILEDTAGIEVVGDVASGEDAVAQTRKLSPDIVLMDVNMPGIGGLEATRQIIKLHNGSRVICVSMHMDGVFPRKLLEAGASGYLTKGCSEEEIIQAIQDVNHGQRYISRDVAQLMAIESVDGKDKGMENLSQRELQVMRMATKGMSNNEISEALHLSPKTVSTYRTRLFTKLGVNSTVELTHLAYKMGIISSSEID